MKPGLGREHRSGTKGLTRQSEVGSAAPRPGLAARKIAARLLSAIVDAHSSLDGLTDPGNGHPQFRNLEPRDQALVRAILSTALRFRVTIQKLIERQLDRALPANAHSLSHILHVAAAQILFLDVPDSAAVDLAVSHAKGDPRTARFGGLVNGVLRSLVRAKEQALPEMLSATVDAPDWLRERLQSAYGAETASAILTAHRAELAMDFTVKENAGEWAERLGGVVLPIGTVRVEKLAASVPDLPGYAEGAWWVQDAAASLPARLFGDVAGQRLADLCAAPGGKTAQLAMAGAMVTAVDISANRLKRLSSNLDRLGLTAQLVTADILEYRPDAPFDAILLDAPCSSTGTIRRHPDVPWTKTPEDVEKLAAVQRRLLDHAIGLLRPGGRIVFSNCSLDPEEGENLINRFLAETDGVVLDPIVAGEFAGLDSFITARGTLRTTPGDMQAETPAASGMDGFFAARLHRVG